METNTQKLTLVYKGHELNISIWSPNRTFIHHLTDTPKKIVFYCSGCKIESADDNLFLNWKSKLKKGDFTPVSFVHYATDRKGNDFFFVHDLKEKNYLLINDKEVRIPMKFFDEENKYHLIDTIAELAGTIAEAKRNESVF